ncbi:4'-phosphopantetheinyl transferase family protein [Haloechinothrix halophila]|uniref:4'-phosphopantetheinyl transferase family protein n=1 Tax=Haloechinothrix halophila TaxID=1069073 RepID=UPI00040BC099|nr:4'-phosphopantetheinyl transferase superfamily protein [Haloechinothrix halophila]
MSVACEVWWSRPLASADDYLDTLDDAERGRFDAYRQNADKQRFLTGRVLARFAIARWLGTKPAEISFDATCQDCGKAHGKPRVIGHDDVALSLSHSGDRVGVAVTTGVPIGLDVESASRNATNDLINYALNDTERTALAGLTSDDAAAAFFSYWARKEALMKATGRGLKIPLRNITLSAPGEPPRLVAADDAALDPAAATLLDVDPGPGYRAAVAALTNVPVEITEHWASL